MKTILIILITLISCKAFAQEDLERQNAQKIRQIIDNRPNPNQFSEQEAWAVLMGEKPESDRYNFDITEYSYFHFLKKEGNREEWYYRSGGWWYTGTDISINNWKPNWLLIISLSACFLFLFFSQRKLMERFQKRRLEYKEEYQKQGEDMRTSWRWANKEAKNSVMGPYIILMFSGYLVLFISQGVCGEAEDTSLFVPVLLFLLPPIIMQIRLSREVNKERRISQEIFKLA